MTYIERQINLLGFDFVKNQYLEMKNSDFIETYHTSCKTAVKLFGHKFKEYKKRKQETYEYVESIRENLNTHKWEIPQENRYWEKEGFEIRKETYLKTKLLP